MIDAKKGDMVHFGILSPQRHLDRLGEIGFSLPLVIGERILPAKYFGNACKINSEGRLVRKIGEPQEMVYHLVRRSWRKDDRRKSKLVDALYWRTPRYHEFPTAFPLTIQARPDGSMTCLLPGIQLRPENEGIMLMMVHMLIELFEEAFALNENLKPLFEGEVRRLDWDILPPGEFPWDRIAGRAAQQNRDLIVGHQNAILSRLRLIRSFEPDFYATGIHGFQGYHIFGFTKHDRYFLESAYWGNATYVLGKNWELLSRCTKRELITAGTFEHRIQHGKNWITEITNQLEKVGKRPKT